MTVREFAEQWLEGSKIIGKILLYELAAFVVIGVLIGAFVLLNMVPEIFLLALVALMMVVFGPWALAEQWGSEGLSDSNNKE